MTEPARPPLSRLPTEVLCEAHSRPGCGRTICRQAWAEKLAKRAARVAAKERAEQIVGDGDTADIPFVDVPALIQERDFWAQRARRAEERLRYISCHIPTAAAELDKARSILAVWRDPVIEGEEE